MQGLGWILGQGNQVPRTLLRVCMLRLKILRAEWRLEITPTAIKIQQNQINKHFLKIHYKYVKVEWVQILENLKIGRRDNYSICGALLISDWGKMVLKEWD